MIDHAPSKISDWISMRTALDRIAELSLAMLEALEGELIREGVLSKVHKKLLQEAREDGTWIRALLRALLANGEIVAGVQRRYGNSVHVLQRFMFNAVSQRLHDIDETIETGRFSINADATAPGSLEREVIIRPVLIDKKGLEKRLRRVRLSGETLARVGHEVVQQQLSEHPGEPMPKKVFTETIKGQLSCKDTLAEAVWAECAPHEWRRPGRRKKNRA